MSSCSEAQGQASACVALTAPLLPLPGAQCYNVSVTAPLTAAEAETLTWCAEGAGGAGSGAAAASLSSPHALGAGGALCCSLVP